MQRLDWRTMALSVGLVAAVMFASCVVYGLVVPSRLHAVMQVAAGQPVAPNSPMTAHAADSDGRLALEAYR
jgi:hypothetical protein